METREDVLRLLANERNSMRRLGVREIGIFGSFARGEQTKKSDVDVLVELRDSSFDTYMNVLFFLEDLLGRKVDLVEKRTVKPLIRNRVLREAMYVQNF